VRARSPRRARSVLRRRRSSPAWLASSLAAAGANGARAVHGIEFE
jgi:hypothetical protein